MEWDKNGILANLIIVTAADDRRTAPRFNAHKYPWADPVSFGCPRVDLDGRLRLPRRQCWTAPRLRST